MLTFFLIVGKPYVTSHFLLCFPAFLTNDRHLSCNNEQALDKYMFPGDEVIQCQAEVLDADGQLQGLSQFSSRLGCLCLSTVIASYLTVEGSESELCCLIS